MGSYSAIPRSAAAPALTRAYGLVSHHLVERRDGSWPRSGRGAGSLALGEMASRHLVRVATPTVVHGPAAAPATEFACATPCLTKCATVSREYPSLMRKWGIESLSPRTQETRWTPQHEGPQRSQRRVGRGRWLAAPHPALAGWSAHALGGSRHVMCRVATLLTAVGRRAPGTGQPALDRRARRTAGRPLGARCGRGGRGGRGSIGIAARALTTPPLSARESRSGPW